MEKKEIVAFRLGDYLDDVREIMLKSRYRSYPVLNGENKVVGTISRFHLLRPRRKRVVLVDHNEAAQSVPALDQVEILEIIDHHRLADIQTTAPIRVRNEPVGSTNTILTAMYQERGVVPSAQIAGIMAGAILSDTVMFKSPTCTKRDIAMAERLARIAGVSLEEIGHELYAAGSTDGKSAEELFPRRLQAVPHLRAEHRRQPDHLRRRRPPACAAGRVPVRHARPEGEAGVRPHHPHDNRRAAGRLAHLLRRQRRHDPAGLQQDAARPLSLPQGRHEPQEADHPHAHRPLGLKAAKAMAEYFEGRRAVRLLSAEEFRAEKDGFRHGGELLRSLGSRALLQGGAYPDCVLGTLRIPRKKLEAGRSCALASTWRTAA